MATVVRSAGAWSNRVYRTLIDARSLDLDQHARVRMLRNTTRVGGGLLDLSNCRLDGHDVALLCDVLCDSDRDRVMELNLSGAHMRTSLGPKQLATFVATSCTLRTLRLRSCCVSELSFRTSVLFPPLIETLRASTCGEPLSLRRLDLRNNRICWREHVNLTSAADDAEVELWL